MTDNIVSLQDHDPRRGVVEMLEDLLERARNGDVSNLAMAVEVFDGDDFVIDVKTTYGSMAGSIGAFEIAKMTFLLSEEG